MSKGTDAKRIPQESGDLDMSPMIDMVFLLLIFFIVNATAITVKKDDRVIMPVANNAGEVKSANGCIVVNVYSGTRDSKTKPYDKSVIWWDDESNPLKTETELKAYIKKKAEMFKSQKYELVLYLRGDQDALFKNTKTAIKAAGEVGVSNVMFAALPNKNK